MKILLNVLILSIFTASLCFARCDYGDGKEGGLWLMPSSDGETLVPVDADEITSRHHDVKNLGKYRGLANNALTCVQTKKISEIPNFLCGLTLNLLSSQKEAKVPHYLNEEIDKPPLKALAHMLAKKPNILKDFAQVKKCSVANKSRWHDVDRFERAAMRQKLAIIEKELQTILSAPK